MDTTPAYTTLISTDQLHTHLTDPTWIIVDCRFDLAQPDWGFANYQGGHISGAVYAHLDHDLAGPITPASGRHPLPATGIFLNTLSRLGISNTSQVVVYDTTAGAYAARLWWMLKYHGHDAVAVLDGGYAKWAAESRPTSGGVNTKMPGIFTSTLRPEMIVDTDQVESFLSNPSIRIIDARAPIRFRGEQEPIDPIAGHIPGAANRFHGQNITPSGTFLPATELRTQFLSLLDHAPAAQSVVYCGSGVTSCHHIVAMASAGLPIPRLYVGSWSEWIRSTTRPIALG